MMRSKSLRFLGADGHSMSIPEGNLLSITGQGCSDRSAFVKYSTPAEMSSAHADPHVEKSVLAQESVEILLKRLTNMGGILFRLVPSCDPVEHMLSYVDINRNAVFFTQLGLDHYERSSQIPFQPRFVNERFMPGLFIEDEFGAAGRLVCTYLKALPLLRSLVRTHPKLSPRAPV